MTNLKLDKSHSFEANIKGDKLKITVKKFNLVTGTSDNSLTATVKKNYEEDVFDYILNNEEKSFTDTNKVRNVAEFIDVINSELS
ncbi:hypothetical protein A2483_04670 [Candidatus Peregrinibacteria bacterium RIFOXYC2_FULL_33_13]|nr:MAG: hypothetical protein UR27_C0020G0003 [Candidatus Peregrinibacteria bacterium GW2011_GWA2_33_10]KKP40123.1 MAG: hypothetical protein UR30_C0006G0028 [Candidatus Peregrinibacteria bacterium GW2011_GWC2_33_13]OGJ50909.1 MAG: hypothetical protein A2229_02645 [Candidatus Peregrinibacteria bacterium RIFOXYA2_FULL_33_7]OGJ52893.1 MAG: hypothetical protein A2483_04670 [Candidatus Peregrinibacteria bacterium RIFOXYC2_FULL_33_13]